MKYLYITLAVFFSLIWLVSIILTVKDKSNAINGKYRVPEKTLMLLGLFGGALPMYITMKNIHHKTKHKKFMIGLPLEILLHIALIIFILIKFNIIKL
ncbi:MAG: DUF1294 domain-containing protein [Clostridiales bacterium]|nr:DUF1294 domain-containing protein [Clostridiales bacterium]